MYSDSSKEKDGIVRAVKLRAENRMESDIQHLYPLELSCVREKITNEQRSVGNTENEDSSRTAQGTDNIEEIWSKLNSVKIAKLLIQDKMESNMSVLLIK